MNRTFEGLLVLVDMDLTIVPWLPHVESMIEEAIGKEAFQQRNETECFLQRQFGEKHYDAIHKILTAQGFFANLPAPFENAIESIHEMKSEGIDVVICTTPMEDSEFCIPEKREYLEKYIGKDFADNAHFPYDKSEIHGDILIDDRTDLLEIATQTPSWTQITFEAYHNKHINVPHRLTHWRDWRKVLTQAIKKDPD